MGERMRKATDPTFMFWAYLLLLFSKMQRMVVNSWHML